jgi:acetoin utilization deacetylase AcuC-like enzyme
LVRKTAIIYHEDLLKHDFGPLHPFRSKERTTLYLDLLEDKGLLKNPEIKIFKPSMVANDDDILAVHDSSLLKLIKNLSSRGGWLDSDTPVPQGTYERAMIQAGAFMEGAEQVMRGQFDRAVLCVVFGGHHATRAHVGRSFGFCYFNYDAMVVKYLQRKGYAKKVFILDCDAHHGNGTQEIFYQDPSVLYMSLHQDPTTLYPGTGYIHEVGERAGEGYTVNVPLPPGTSDPSYLKALREVFPPLVESYEPDIILFVIGADTYHADPLTALRLSMHCYPEIAKIVVEAANDVCDGKLLVELGGGYDVKATAYAFYLTTATTAEVQGIEINETYRRLSEDPSVQRRVEQVLREVKASLAKFWTCFR